MQGVVGHFVGADIFPDLGLAPVRQRIELRHAVGRIVFLHRELGTRARLGAALARDPGLLAGQRMAERLDLADAAALLAHLDAVVEGVQAVLRDIPVDGRRIGAEQGDLIAIGFLDRVQHGQGFLRQAPRLQREDTDRQLRAQDQVGQHHVFRRQAGGEHGRGELGRDARQDGLRIRYAGSEVAHRVPQIPAPASLCSSGTSRSLRRNSGSGWSTEAW